MRMNKLDQDIQDLKVEKQLLESLNRLLNNSDFKRVIMDDFLSKHPLRLIQGKGVLKLDPQINQDIDRQLDGVALFKMYLDQLTSGIADIDYRISDAETLREEQTRNT